LLTDRQTNRQTNTGKTCTSSFVGGNKIENERGQDGHPTLLAKSMLIGNWQ